MSTESNPILSYGKYVIPSLFAFGLIAGAIYTSEDKTLNLQDAVETVYVKEPSPIVVSATHLKEIDGYVKVYDVPNTDRSYYINTSYNYAKVDIDAKVVISTTQGLIQGKVEESVEGAFRVKVDDPSLIFNGMSGSRVLIKGEEIGFVSELTDDLEILCYTIN